jgi:hypothetical protein
MAGRLLALVAGLSFAGGCPQSDDGKRARTASSGPDQGLLTAYELLEDTLREEARLGMLGVLKKITFQRPVPEIDEMMKRLSETSKARLEELEELRALPPDVTQPPDFSDPIGEAITSNATKLGTGEMVEIGGSFGVRFVLLQAQATRMVHAIAAAAAEIESNERRRKWLTDLGDEYEGYRDELVVIVEKYILQQGAVKPE